MGKCHPAHPIPQVLLEIDLRNDRNETPFLLACRKERLDMVKKILEASSYLKISFGEKDMMGWTMNFKEMIKRSFYAQCYSAR